MELLMRLERMEKTISETNSVVKDVQDQLKSASNGKNSSLSVIDNTHLGNARTAVRAMMKLMSRRADPFVLTYDAYDDVLAVRDAVVKEILINRSHRPWANEEILNKAFHQVWKNKRDDHNRELSGKKTNHRANNRRNNRRLRKLNRRTKAVEKSRRSEDWKTKVRTVLTRECTSPDITDSEDGGDQRVVLPLIWESQTLRDIKEHLDQVANIKEQEDHPSLYATGQPSQQVPSWAIRNRYKQTAETSIGPGSDQETSRTAATSSTSWTSAEPITSLLSSSPPPSSSSSSSPPPPSSSSSSSSSPPPSPPNNLLSSQDLFSDVSFSPSSLPQSTPTSRPGKR